MVAGILSPCNVAYGSGIMTFISAILDFRGPIMGSLRSPCMTSYRSSIETIALNCFVFEKIALCILATNRQTDGQATLAVASGALITYGDVSDVIMYLVNPFW